MTLIRQFFAPAALALILAAGITGTQAAPGQLTVQVDQPGVKISPVFNGLMIEDINHSIDGGLYGELIQNRALNDDPNKPAHWSLVQEGGGAGAMTLDGSQPVPGTALTHCLRLDITATVGRVGVANDGYWGIPVKPNTTYRASFYARAMPGDAPLTVGLESTDGKTVPAQAQSPAIGRDWKKYTVTLTTGNGVTPSVANRFVISAHASGTIWLTQISLMPPTYHNRPNGTRLDLMEKLAGMQPRFLRLPGGNYLEGNRIAERFDWKKTIGDLSQRPGHPDPWGYRSDDGFGLLEYLEWCEDLQMHPVLAVFAGYALGGEHVPAGPELTPFVQDAVDEIEYVTGGPDTVWGAKRAADGHPAPFPLTYVEIGNEDGFDKSGSYDGRFAQFYDAIKAKYPKLQLIATAGGLKLRPPDVVDDHYYRSAAEMERDAGHYDGYSRTGPKIFVGEWASTEGSPTPNMQAALGDAAWLTGLERNSDLVVMEAYAPLLINVNPGASQWGTNLIGFDALQSFVSPSCYVQAIFAANTGDVVLPTHLIQPSVSPVAGPLPTGKIGVATWATQAEFKDILVMQNGKTLYQKNFADGDADWTLEQGQWQVQDGVLRQTSDSTNCRADAGDAGWGDYIYTLKARKLSGAEGFLISFHVQDDSTRIWWNIGGWGNTRTALERFTEGDHREIGSVPVTVETGRWYDIKIEVQGRQIRCYLDGKLITETTDTPAGMAAPIYAAASRDLKTGDVILKVVNVSAEAQSLQINLPGAHGIAKSAQATALTGEPGDVNSLAAPEKVAPVTLTLTGIGGTFMQRFPAHSITALRIGARK